MALRKVCPADDIAVRERERAGCCSAGTSSPGVAIKTAPPARRIASPALLIRRKSLLQYPVRMVALQRHQIAKAVPQKPLQETRICLGDAVAHFKKPGFRRVPSMDEVLGLHCLSELVLYAVHNRIDQIAEPVLEDPVGEQSCIVPSIPAA